MRENRPYGSEGGEALVLPDPYRNGPLANYSFKEIRATSRYRNSFATGTKSSSIGILREMKFWSAMCRTSASSVGRLASIPYG